MSRWLPLMENFDILRDAYQGQYNDGSRLVKSMEADGIAILTDLAPKNHTILNVSIPMIN